MEAGKDKTEEEMDVRLSWMLEGRDVMMNGNRKDEGRKWRMNGKAKGRKEQWL